MCVTYKICSFFGHRDIVVTDELMQRLYVLIENLIVNENFGVFFFGGLSDFDELCWQVVTQLKQKYQFIKRIYCLIEPKYLRKLPRWLDRKNYEEFIYLDLKFDWWYQRIYFRNEEIIRHSDFVVFYVNETENSGAYKAMQIAKKLKKPYKNMT